MSDNASYRQQFDIVLRYECSHKCGSYSPRRLPNGSDPEIYSVHKFLQDADGGGYGKFIEVSDRAAGTKYMELSRLPGGL